MYTGIYNKSLKLKKDIKTKAAVLNQELKDIEFKDALRH